MQFKLIAEEIHIKFSESGSNTIKGENTPISYSVQELDDGWHESVEEQGLLLLVWRHHITKQYIKDVL